MAKMMGTRFNVRLVGIIGKPPNAVQQKFALENRVSCKKEHVPIGMDEVQHVA